MPNIAFFTHNMKTHVLRKQVAKHELKSIYRIELICPTTQFRSDAIYVGEAADIADLLIQQKPHCTVTIFSSKDIYRFDAFAKCPHLNLIATNYTLPELYNQVSKIWSYYYRWDLTISNALCSGHDLNQIIQTAAKMLNGHILLLNPGYTKLSQGYTEAYSDRFTEELREKNFLNYESVQFFTQQLKASTNHHNTVTRFSINETGNTYFYMPIQATDDPLAILLFIVNALHKDMDIYEMIESLGNVVTRLLNENRYTSLNINSALKSLLADYTEQGSLNEMEVKNRFLLMPHPVKEFLRCMIVHFDGAKQDVPYEFIINQLYELLPDANITIWNNELVILHSQEARAQELEGICDLERFSNLLGQFHAKAIISSQTRYMDKFYTLYILSSQVFKIITRMNIASPIPNIYQYENYLLYLAIDLATQHFESMVHHSDIIYMADSSIITLARYDQHHHSDLLSLLYHYLLNGRNVTKTAKMLYMHRNTVLNKINKINELINLPLEDGQVQHRLLFSCQLVLYYQNYLVTPLHL